MNKRELLDAVQRLAALDVETIDRKTVQTVLDALAAVSQATLMGGGQVALPGLGKLGIQTRQARIGRNPRTGESVAIPEKKALKFSPERQLKLALADSALSSDTASN